MIVDCALSEPRGRHHEAVIDQQAAHIKAAAPTINQAVRALAAIHIVLSKSLSQILDGALTPQGRESFVKCQNSVDDHGSV